MKAAVEPSLPSALMSATLQLQNPRERALVRSADAALAPLAWFRRAAPPAIQRILLLRLERIGDLLMTLDAVRDVREAWPDARIDLAVGSWNASLAPLIPGIGRVHVADVPWLSRGESAASWASLIRAARAWKRERYDLVINFEPDIRSNFLAWLTGAPVRAGYASGGGGAFMTTTGRYDPAEHVSTNARRLVAAAAPATISDVASHPRLVVPESARQRAELMIGRTVGQPIVGIHVPGGRESKQWHFDRFAEVARTVAARTSAKIVLTGGPADRPAVDRVAAQLPDVALVNAAGALELPDLAALLASLDVLVTSDTGPMHMAAAVGTPVVALFGPSDPARYGPRATHERIVRAGIACSPCGMVRLPPERCRGHVPDCMDGIATDTVVRHTLELLDIVRNRAR